MRRRREPISALRTRTIVEDASCDSELIADSIATPAGFGAIFDRHFDSIHAYLQRQVGRDLADELAAQTFLVAFDGRARYDVSRPSARPWLFGIATNLLRRHRRDATRQLRAYARTGVDPVVDAFDGAEARVDALGMRRQLARALSRLTPEELDTLLLYAWADLSYAEIGETLKLPVGTVRSRLHRARERISELLDADRARTSSPLFRGDGGQQWTRSN
jgi:RNA polymerase sigma factor (sigma-70 family)